MMLKEFLRKYYPYPQEKHAAYVETYLAANERLRQVIEQADQASASTGANHSDYIVLWEFIKQRKPRYVLECGTGKSTWVLAEAMLDVQREIGGEVKLISMEHDQGWYDHACSIFPEKYAALAEIHHADIDYYSYSFVRGTVYEEIPSYPYDLVFVDGPDQEFEREDGTYEHVCNMDFVRLVRASDHPVSAIIDWRVHTVLAYSMIFGPEHVTYYKLWRLGVVEAVTRDDLALDDKPTMIKRVFKHMAHYDLGNPF